MLCEVPYCDRPFQTYGGGKKICYGHRTRYLKHGHFQEDEPLGLRKQRSVDWLPAAPLRDFIAKYRRRLGAGGMEMIPYSELSILAGISEGTLRNLCRRKSQRVHERTVDTIICNLGSHPTAVYGDDWLVYTVRDERVPA